MRSIKTSEATELKKGGNLDQGPVIPKNTTNLDIDIDIDFDSQGENDFYEDLNCTDDQYEEQCNSTPNPICNEVYQKYDDYSSLMHGLYEHMPVDCAAIRMSWSNLLIYKSNNEFFYYYSVYDTSKREDSGYYLEIGDCMDPDDVSRIISYYLETGKCFDHR